MDREVNDALHAACKTAGGNADEGNIGNCEHLKPGDGYTTQSLMDANTGEVIMTGNCCDKCLAEARAVILRLRGIKAVVKVG